MNHPRTFVFLSLSIAFTFLAAPAWADTQEVDGVTWGYSLQDGYATVTNATPATGALVIPVSLGDCPVTSIESYAFSDCSGLTSVTIGDSVTSIGDFAFYGCSGLTSVTIGNSVTSIGEEAFSYCDGLTSVTIPDSVTSIGYGAFRGCSGLYDTNTIPGVCLVDGWAVDGINSLAGILDLTGIRGIGVLAFSGCRGLTSVTIPNGVTNIGGWAFSGCSGLTSVTIPNGVTSIGDGAFSDCSGLTSVTIPNGVTNIGSRVFSDCSGLTSVTIGNGVTSIGDSAFSGCSDLTSVTIPNGVTNIGGWAFSGCSGLTSVEIPESVVYLDTTAFDGCGRLWTAWYRTLANLAAGGGGSGGGGSGGGSSGGGKTVSLTVTNVIVHYVTQSVPSGAVMPVTNSTGIVNVIAEVTAGKAIAISEDWAKQYPAFEATFGGDFAAALTMETGKRDGVGNPMHVWQDYVAGTDPTDPGSVFTASLTFDTETHEPVISWSPELSPSEAAKRRYAVSGKVSLLDPDWVPVEGNAGEFNFFRVSVEMR